MDVGGNEALEYNYDVEDGTPPSPSKSDRVRCTAKNPEYGHVEGVRRGLEYICESIVDRSGLPTLTRFSHCQAVPITPPHVRPQTVIKTISPYHC